MMEDGLHLNPSQKIKKGFIKKARCLGRDQKINLDGIQGSAPSKGNQAPTSLSAFSGCWTPSVNLAKGTRRVENGELSIAGDFSSRQMSVGTDSSMRSGQEGFFLLERNRELQAELREKNDRLLELGRRCQDMYGKLTSEAKKEENLSLMGKKMPQDQVEKLKEIRERLRRVDFGPLLSSISRVTS